ncbi:gfo/Idh/MocA family oxidoreductase [candidate division KSB3 bacterium]|uniref:Gfo/Idh/MocA family oxidoreductase n=1 Tax=candidate division KSB3 bacterium TaxID=2044937 RepID=A0A9D5JY04_9BACT|nr:gfo/Idh/MocA family oxidoreductase [candidate division KSB3 bacterium]MBD3326200.1 gfo/Idh/MocA family oxidoreductase [candidate division KSB3 bacterium]
MSANVTVAQLGCGYWGPNVLRNFSTHKRCEVKWVVETSPERRAYVETNYPGVQLTDDWKTAISDPDVDLVAIVTPAATHFSLAQAALEQQKHVFVEKPLANTVAQAETLVALAQTHHRKLFVGHTFLYNAAVRTIKDYIDSGELGEIYYIFTQRLNLGRVRQDVNAMWNLAPHDISILLYWLGEDPQRVFARGFSFLQEGIEDVVFLHLDFPSGKFAHIHTSWLDPCKVRKIVIVGSKKMIVYDDTSADAKVMIYDKGIDKKTMYEAGEPFHSFGQFQLLQRTGDMVVPHLRFPEPLQVQADHIITCITQDTPPLTDGYSGLQVVRVLETAQQALEADAKEVGQL